MNAPDAKNIKQWARMGPRAMYGQFMLELAETVPNLMVMSADLGRSSGLNAFKNTYPNKYLSVGISEQNLVGVAAGLAKEGHKVFVTSFAPFLSMRASEQVRMNLGYMELPVNLVALGSGVSMGFLGNSHYGLEDIAVMRTIPGLGVHCPADCFDLRETLVDLATNERGPTYVRLTGVPGHPPAYDETFQYAYGEPTTVAKGDKVLILAIGALVSVAGEAVQVLADKGISAELLGINRLKPMPDKVMERIREFDYVVTVEEHTIIGGLYSTVAEQVGLLNLRKNLLPISLPDEFGPTGSYNYLLDYYGFTGDKIAARVEAFISGPITN